MRKPRNLKKKACALLLAAAMSVTAFPQLGTTVYAAEQDAAQFATAEQLKTYNTATAGASAKVYFGKNGEKDQQWWIAGEESNNIVLFAASPLATGQPFELNWTQNKTYSEAWKCDYTSNGGTNPTEVFPNHYGASPLRTTLQDLETSHFTSEEQKLMNTTTVYTQDTKNKDSGQPLKYSTTDKLYLAYSAGYGESYKHVTVGTNSATGLSDGLRIDMSYWGGQQPFLAARA